MSSRHLIDRLENRQVTLDRAPQFKGKLYLIFIYCITYKSQYPLNFTILASSTFPLTFLRMCITGQTAFALLGVFKMDITEKPLAKQII